MRQRHNSLFSAIGREDQAGTVAHNRIINRQAPTRRSRPAVSYPLGQADREETRSGLPHRRTARRMSRDPHDTGFRSRLRFAPSPRKLKRP